MHRGLRQVDLFVLLDSSRGRDDLFYPPIPQSFVSPNAVLGDQNVLQYRAQNRRQRARQFYVARGPETGDRSAEGAGDVHSQKRTHGIRYIP